MGNIGDMEIPLPTLVEQIEIVKAIDEEVQIVEQNKKLMQLFEAKIKNKIAQVWGVKASADKEAVVA
jgi:type I restriction enzyme M protein